MVFFASPTRAACARSLARQRRAVFSMRIDFNLKPQRRALSKSSPKAAASRPYTLPTFHGMIAINLKRRPPAPAQWFPDASNKRAVISILAVVLYWVLEVFVLHGK